MDTRIWPEAESFKDEGFGLPPKKWKGVCEGGKNFTCNKKIVGARYYLTDSARDFQGHGTHCASIVARSPVKDASFYRLANGIAKGGVLAARIAAYKVCDLGFGCSSDGILAAFDDAIADVVDIISISLNGFFHSEPYFYIDRIAIGALRAMKKGILTSQSARTIFNSYKVGSVSSVAPWIFTVATSTTYRRIDSTVLANRKKLVGHSTNTFTLNGTNFPLIYGKDASRSNCFQMLARVPQATILQSEVIKDVVAPLVSITSATGPNLVDYVMNLMILHLLDCCIYLTM